MTFIGFVRRRVFGKIIPVFKRVILPAGIIILILRTLKGTEQETKQVASPKEEVVYPGEVLDPLLRRSPEVKQQPKHDTPLFDSKDPPPNIIGIPHINHQSPQSNSQDKQQQQQQQNKDKKDAKDKREIKKDGYFDNDVKRLSSSWSMATANITDSDKVRFRSHAISEQTVTLTLMTSADKVFMSINKREIYRGLEDRGLHIVVLNQHTGRVMAKQVFDTFTLGTENEMVEFIDNVSDGRIIVFAVRDDAATGLTWRGRNKLRELGSRWADKIGYRDMWALITRQGGLKLAESYSNVATADTGYEWGGPLFLRTDFDLIEDSGACNWEKNERNDMRRLFCARYEGYGELCRCDVKQWKDIFFQHDDQIHRELTQNKYFNEFGIVIISNNRPLYLYRTLKWLWEAPGLNKEKIAIYCEKPHRELSNLAKLFGITLIDTPKPTGNTSAQNLRYKLQRAFKELVGAKFSKESVPNGGVLEDTIPPFSSSFVFVLEDDIQVSIDIFKYLYSIAPLIDQDPTIIAISAFNYHGYRDVASSLTSFYRSNRVNNMALLIPARAIRDVLAPNWPLVDDDTEWHKVLKTHLILHKNDAVVYPEVPRARHTGYSGRLVSGGIQHHLFQHHILALTTQYTISSEDVNRLSLHNYGKWLTATLKSSDPLTFDFCKHDLTYGENPLVMFIKMDDIDEDDAWRNVMKCLGTWTVYVEGGWEGVWHFHYHGHVLSIVATPLSSYSNLIPADYIPITAPPQTTTTTTTTTSTTTMTSSSSSSSSSQNPKSQDKLNKIKDNL